MGVSNFCTYAIDFGSSKTPYIIEVVRYKMSPVVSD